MMSLLKNFVFPLVVSKVDSNAEINYQLFSDPVFQTTYFQTQHTVGSLFTLYVRHKFAVDKTGGILFHCQASRGSL